jgi:hypothetical protein
VAISHAVVLTGALLALLSIPCVLVMVVSPDELAVRRSAFRRALTDRRAHRVLDRKIHQPPQLGQMAAGRQRLPAIEQIAAELRRLDRQRRGGPTRESEAWSAAVACAYDSWLRLACRRLDVDEHLAELCGTDRDIERVRVAGALEAAGLVLRSAADRPPG